MKRIYTVPLILSVLLAGSPAFGQARGNWHHDRGRMKERVAQKLGLTDAQREQIRQLRETSMEGLKAARLAVRDKRQALEDAMMAEGANQATIDARRAELSRAHDELTRQMTDARLKAMQVLTVQQRDQLRQMRDEMRQRRDEMRKRFEERRQQRDNTLR